MCRLMHNLRNITYSSVRPYNSVYHIIGTVQTEGVWEHATVVVIWTRGPEVTWGQTKLRKWGQE
jgi:hypothetical protein